MWWDSATRYLDGLPKLWEQVEEVGVLGAVVEPELDGIKRRLRQLIFNRYPQWANEVGISRWEEILGVSAPIKGDLSSRRQAVLSTLQTRPPISVDTVRQIAQTYLGVPVELRLLRYHLWVAYRGQTKLTDLTPLTRLLRELLPANITFEISYAYTIWRELKGTVTSWEILAPNTWREVRMGEYKEISRALWERYEGTQWMGLEEKKWERVERGGLDGNKN